MRLRTARFDRLIRASLLGAVLTSSALLAPLTLSTTAAAQAEPGPEARKEAEARFAAGLKYYDARDFEHARAAFLEAYAVYRTAGIVRNLALSELYGGRHLDAIRHLREYFAMPDVAQDKKDDAKKYFDEAFAKTGHLRIKADPGTAIMVAERTHTAPLADVVDAPVGTVRIVARGGGRELVKEATTTAGGIVDVDMSFPAGPKETGGAGTNNGKEHAREPFTPPPTSQGETRWGTGQTVGVITAGVGAVALGVGAVFLVGKGQSSERVDALESDIARSGVTCPGTPPIGACTELESKRDERDERGAIGLGLMIGGAVALVAGAVTFFVWPRERASASTFKLQPVVGAQSGFALHF